MKVDDLRDRKDFLEMQMNIVSERLDACIRENAAAADAAVTACSAPRVPVADLELYLHHRCASFREHCTDLIECLANNLVLSRTRIDYNFFTNLFRVDYAFRVLAERTAARGFRVNALVDINTGEVSFNRAGGGHRTPADSTSPADTRSGQQGDTAYQKIKQENNKFIKGDGTPRPRAAEREARGKSQVSDDYDTLSSLYKHSFPSMNFLTMDFPSCSFPHLQALFARPFSINICLNEMNDSIGAGKVAVVLRKACSLKAMDVEELLTLSTVEYSMSYPYNEVIALDELDDGRFAPDIAGFLSDVPSAKKMPLLNFVLNVAPGLLHSVDLSQLEGLPHAYLLEWIAAYQNSPE